MNWGDFFSMDGRSIYVWGSFGAFALALGVEVLVLRLHAASVRADAREERTARRLAGK